MSRTLRAYQVVATLVGLNLLFVVTAAVAQRTTSELSWWNHHPDLVRVIEQVHGGLFMVLLVLIAILHTRERWKPGFTVSTMLLATIPFVTFYAERRTTHAVRDGSHRRAVASP